LEQVGLGAPNKEPGAPESPGSVDWNQAANAVSEALRPYFDPNALTELANRMFKPATDVQKYATQTPVSPVLLPRGVDAHSLSSSAVQDPASAWAAVMPAIPTMPLIPGMPSMASVGTPDRWFPRELDREWLGLSTSAMSLGAPSFPGLGDANRLSYYFLDEATQISGGVANTLLADAGGFKPDLVPNLSLARDIYDVDSIRRDFPILEELVHGRRLVWLDNGATTQKPQAVIDRLSHFYAHENSNVHRGAHELAGRATDAYEAAREVVRRFLNAGSTREIIFTRGTTEAINLVAQSWGRRYVEEGDEVVITWLEHHSNIVPWQLLCAEKGARLRVAPVDDSGQILLSEYERLFNAHTRIAAIAHVSNALGTVFPVREMTEIAHRHGAKVLIDGAQAISHMAVDVQDLGCDFYTFSGHKIFAPTGIGALFARSEVLDTMPPWQGGGNMISDVTFEKTVYQSGNARFEAGTGSLADAVGLGEALNYVERLGRDNIARHEQELIDYALRELRTIPGLRMIGNPPERAGVVSFVLDHMRVEDVGRALDAEGIAVRAGHHCAQPALRRFGVESSVRPSFALYNTCEDVDALIAALRKITAGRGAGPRRTDL
jgi:cysteine desulfurase/selenocysteine lyase